MSKYIFLLVAILSSKTTIAQNTNQLLELHYENIKQLYMARGVSNDWSNNGIVEESEIKELISYYGSSKNKNNVGILLYSHYSDTLSVLLYRLNNKNLTKLEVKHSIDKESLNLTIAKLNNSLSNPYYKNRVHERGVNIVSEDNTPLADAIAEAQKILLPFTDSLISLNHLIIVPTLTIGTIPFAAFPFSDSLRLIDHLSISVAPSILEVMVSNYMNGHTLRGNFIRGERRAEEVSYNFRNALLVANPIYPTNLNQNFPLLPGTLSEINTVIKNIDGGNYNLLLGKEANPANVLSNIHSRDLLYFATHGISSAENALDSSFLIFAYDSSKSYLISSREIMDLRKTSELNADLVILSACQSGLGVQHQGGIIGLARAFQIAGANHVVMSMWSINDKETAILMGFFFDNLQNSAYLMPHEALRKAILKYRREINDDPSVWAAFTIMDIPY